MGLKEFVRSLPGYEAANNPQPMKRTYLYGKKRPNLAETMRDRFYHPSAFGEYPPADALHAIPQAPPQHQFSVPPAARPQQPMSFGEFTMPAGNQPRFPGMDPNAAAAQTAQERSQLMQGMRARLGVPNGYGVGGFQPNGGRPYGLQPPSVLNSRVGDIENPAGRSPLNPTNGIPMEQRPFAAHQGIGQYGAPGGLPMTAGGPLYGQGQRDAGVTPDAYGFAAGRPQSRQNFVPDMPQNAAAGGAPGILGSIGNSTVFRRPGEMQPGVAGSQMSLMGGTAAREYNSAVQGGESPKSALRQTQRDAQDRYRQSPQFASLVQRQQQQNAATQAKNSDLRGLAQARRLGVPPDQAMVGRLGGNGGSPMGGGLTLADRTSLLDQESQPKLTSMLGFSPLTSSPSEVLDAATHSLKSIHPGDTKGRQAILQGVQAARSRKDFANRGFFGDYGNALAQLDSLLKNPDQHLKGSKKSKQPPLQPGLKASMVPGTYMMPSPR